VAGAVLVLVGLASWVLYAVAAHRENRAYSPHGAPPAYVRVAAGHTYWLAVPGGVEKLRAAGIDPARLTCTAAARGEAAGALAVTSAVTASNPDSKFTDRIGSFVAARSAQLHIGCAGIASVYVENPEDGGFDWSGAWLVLASAALVVGLPLLASGLRRPRVPVRTLDGEDDEVE
jgi:drug/metabolite transporter (DMT)-like permease